MTDPRDIPEAELRLLYREYLHGLGRAVPIVAHRQDRSVPGANGPTGDLAQPCAGHALVVFGDYAPDEVT